MNELVDLGALHPRLAHLDRPSNGFTPGFCRAIGSRFGIDPLLIRVLFILTSALSGVGVIAYGWGILLTPRAGRQALIHRLLPVFTSWSLRTQWTVIVLSSTLVVAAVSQMLSSLSSVLLLPLFALVLYSRWREPRRRPVSPSFPWWISTPPRRPNPSQSNACDAPGSARGWCCSSAISRPPVSSYLVC